MTLNSSSGTKDQSSGMESFRIRQGYVPTYPYHVFVHSLPLDFILCPKTSTDLQVHPRNRLYSIDPSWHFFGVHHEVLSSVYTDRPSSVWTSSNWFRYLPPNSLLDTVLIPMCWSRMSSRRGSVVVSGRYEVEDPVITVDLHGVSTCINHGWSNTDQKYIRLLHVCIFPTLNTFLVYQRIPISKTWPTSLYLQYSSNSKLLY